jgi:hypothetical protein
MRILCIFYFDIEIKALIGVRKKIEGQINAFKKNGCLVDTIFPHENVLKMITLKLSI